MSRPRSPRCRAQRAAAALAATALAVLAVGAVSLSPASGGTANAQASGLGSGGEYHPLNPARVLDTRNGINIAAGARPTSPSGAAFDVPLLDRGGIPGTAGNVLAVVLNVTVTEPGSGGYLSIRPTGAARSETSLVNFAPGKTVPNMVVVGVGSGGQATVELTTPAGNSSAHVLIDVFGWISTSSFGTSGSRIVPVPPARILDTRSDPVPSGWGSGQAMGQQQQLTLPVRGSGGVPNDGSITGVVVNLTGVNVGGGFTYLSAMPDPMPPGNEAPTSVTNLDAGQVKANTAIVPIGADGNIRLFNRMSSTHVIVDVLGYLQKGHSPTSTTGRVIPLESPFRAFDTRQVAFANVPLGTNATEDWSFQAFANSVRFPGSIAAHAQSGLIGNLTATGLGRNVPSTPVGSYLTAFPGDVGRPNSSHLNIREGESVPNMALLKYGARSGDPNTLRVYNYEGSVHYMLDVYAVILS